MAGITPIENVPHSPNTSNNPTYLHNPLDEDYHFMRGGKPYMVPAKSKKMFAEFVAYNGAKHLAKLIARRQHDEGLKFQTRDDKDPDAWKKVSSTVPSKRLQEIMASLVSTPDSLVEKIEKTEGKPEPETEPEKESIEEEVDYEAMSWGDLRKYATTKGIYKVGMKRLDILEELDKT